MSDNKKNIKNVFFPNKDGASHLEFIKGIFPDKEINIVDKSRDVSLDLIVFTGGPDVHPDYYGQAVGKHTYTDKKRDEVEQKLFHDIWYGVPKLGICRGAQFLTVMCGGKLIQHVTGHQNCTDNIEVQIIGESTLDYHQDRHRVISIPSDHHQMMYPFSMQKKDYEIIGYSEYFKSNTYLNGNDEETKLPDDFVEPEIVYYKPYNSLAIQSHPEWITDKNDQSLRFIYNIIQEKLFTNEQI